MDSAYRVKIEGRLLDEEEEVSDSEDSEDEEEATNGDPMDEDGKPKQSSKPEKKEYKFSHFFKAMTVDFDRSKVKDDQSVEWKKPAPGPNSANLPNAADFDQLEFKRGGDENMNITVNLTRDENPEIFLYRPALAELLDATEGTRGDAVIGIYEYAKLNNLQEDDEKRSFDCDDRLRAVSSLEVLLRE